MRLRFKEKLLHKKHLNHMRCTLKMYKINPNTNVHQLPISLDNFALLCQSQVSTEKQETDKCNQLAAPEPHNNILTVLWHGTFKMSLSILYFLCPVANYTLHSTDKQEINAISCQCDVKKMCGLFRLNLHCIAGFHNVTKRTL